MSTRRASGNGSSAVADAAYGVTAAYRSRLLATHSPARSGGGRGEGLDTSRPTPRDPPKHLGADRGQGVWRVAVAIWYRHQAQGLVCRECGRPNPCPNAISYGNILMTLLDYPTGWCLERQATTKEDKPCRSSTRSSPRSRPRKPS